MVFFILFQICGFFVQPTELRSSIRSAAGFHVSDHIAAIGDRNLGAICCARAVNRSAD